MIDEERLNIFVELMATIISRQDLSQDTLEMLDDFADNGILKEEET